MLDQNSALRLPIRSITETTDNVMNKFERATLISKSKIQDSRDELLKSQNRETFLRAFPQSRRHYRYHSVVCVSVDHLTSYEKNLKFLKRMKQKTAINTDFVIAECLEIHEMLLDGQHKEIVYDLIGLVLEFKDIEVAKLRESECEKIFRKIQALISSLTCPRRERAASIECQPLREDIYDERLNKELKIKGRIKFLLAKFEFIIATLGHFIHYNKIANTPQKKVFNRSTTHRGSAILFNATFTSMEIKSKSESPKRHSMRHDIRTISRKESLDGYGLCERVQASREEMDDTLKESKFQQVKAYFKWKLEKWKDQDLEEIVLVCRICSKSMSAKIMKKHSPHCKKVTEEERIMKEFSKKIADVIHGANKEKRNVNVDLLLEKKQLTTLKAQTDWHKDPEYGDAFDCLTPTPMFFKNQRSEFTFELDPPTLMNSKPLENKIKQVREELCSLDLAPPSEKETADSPKEGPSSLFSPFDTETNKLCFPSESILNSPMEFLKPPARKYSRDSSRESKKGQATKRSRSQAKSDEDESSLNTSFELDTKKTLGSSLFSPPLLHGKSCSPGREPLDKELSPPNSALLIPNSSLLIPNSPFVLDNCSEKGSEGLGVRRSQTLNLRVALAASPSRRESKRMSSKWDLKILRNPADASTLNALREKVGKIKELQTLIRGCDVLRTHAEMIDNFNEYSSEARVAFEEGRTEVTYFLEKLSTHKKFAEYAREFINLSTDKLEKMRLIDLSKKEIKNLEIIAYETSESNKEDSGMVGVNLDVKSSWDSIDMGPNNDISAGNRNSITMSKNGSESPRKTSMATPEDSPIMRKSRKLRSKSVGKSDLNHRYKMFEKNLQKILKNLKKEKESASNSPSKIARSQFYRNSLMSLVFEEDLQDDSIQAKSVEEVRARARKSSHFSQLPGLHDKIDLESEIISESSDEDDSDDSSDDEDSAEQIDEDDNIILAGEHEEKSFFSDDEGNRKRCAKKQEEGFSSIITISDFEFIKLISKGAYGRVWLVQRKITGDYYAMKIIDFAERKNMNQIDSLKKEKKVFEVIKGDFVVKAVFTFVHNNYLCIVMEFMIGGDFSSILEKFGALDEHVAKFYIAEMVEAVSNLHQLGIVHRDLKPDNILLNKNGHIKLTDFGLSEVGIQKHTKTKQARKRSSIFNSLVPNERRPSLIVPNSNNGICKKHFEKPTGSILSDQFSTIPEVDEEAPENGAPRKGNRIVGTPDYMAPEVISGATYDDPCIDWWSVGVILFEFIVGIPPFNDSCKEGVFSNILRRNIPWDELQIGYDEGCVTPEAKDLIDRLLESDRTKRLGVKGVDEIKNHPFFKGIDWHNILKSKPPIIPVTENDIDVSNFENTNKTFHQSELESPFLDRGSPRGGAPVNVALNKATFEFARVDILHEENQKVVQQATTTISQEELEKMRNHRLKNRKWSVFD